MIEIQAKPSIRARLWRKIPARILSVLIAAAVIGASTRYISAALDKVPSRAGFSRGLLQGALMPAAMPNLLVGNDVTIYAQNNTGVPYKLGYTCGVNVCGVVFFGLFFLRVNRWRDRRDARA
ncbi:MAG TPA: hypothetical protein VFD66_01720 [Verrucomicrobiae bacterium]|nr:hypothetical protein [Verrucomicrobiae bacterium]